MTLFNKKVKEEYKKSKLNINISPSYKEFLDNLFQNINTRYSTPQINIKYNVSSSFPIIKEIYKKTVVEGIYVSSNIKHTLHKYKQVHYCNLDNNHIYYFSTKNTLSVKEKNIIEKALWRIKALKDFFNNNKEIHIGIYPTGFKKTINKIGKKLNPLGVNNVNSGMTYYKYGDIENGRIVIWRLEELNKVLIHELFHAIKVDMGLILNEDVFKTYMKANFKLNNFIGINESYIETLANIFNIIFVCLETKSTNEGNKQLIKRFNNNVQIEIYYSITKASQILHYYGLSNLNELIQNQHIQFIQNSNVFSYYILKTFILCNFSSVISTLFNHKCLYNKLMINMNKECSKNYLTIISKIYNKSIDNMITNIIQRKLFINNSLRMTWCE